MTRNLETPAAESFDWPLCHDAERLIAEQITAFQQRNTTAASLAQRMRDETGTDFFEWVDYLVVTPDLEPALTAAGFVPDDVGTPDGRRALYHPRAMMPRVLLADSVAAGNSPAELAIRPEFVADFVAAHGLEAEIEGAPRSRYRRVLVSVENGAKLFAVERMAYRGYVIADNPPGWLEAVVQAREILQTRKRRSDDDDVSVQRAFEAVDRAVGLVGRDVACHLFFEVERAYWEFRNRAGRIQKRRQDTLGLGWGNHDHHTFRCSRRYFSDLITLLTRFGFEKRERFYAGAEAGWGAQVLEQKTAGIVVFADVDLMPDETEIDFSTERLREVDELHTVGLWTGLHGESFLDAGMHHLEARFDFDRLRDQLAGEGIGTMKPFSDFEFLRQAFTEGERWPVNPVRASRLLEAGLITREQHDTFLRDGAIGSHLENLQRRGGFKGFNQKAVSVIIAATDPRAVAAGAH